MTFTVAMEPTPLLANVSAADAPPPSIILVIPRGEFPHRLGLQRLDERALRRIAADLAARPHDVVVDYAHGSLAAANGEQGIAAGWIDPATARITPDGIEASVRWTAKAAAMIEAGEYRYLSPVLAFDRDRSGEALHITRLVNVGLTNNPNIPAMRPLVNQEENSEMDLTYELIMLLGLSTDASPEEVLAAVQALVAEEDTGDAADPAAAASPADATPGAAAVNDALVRRVAELERAETERLVNDALAAGRIAPSQLPWARDYAAADRSGFAAYCANARAIPLSPSPAASPAAVAAGSISDEERAILAFFPAIGEEDYLSLKRREPRDA